MSSLTREWNYVFRISIHITLLTFQDDPEETQSARSAQSSPQPPHDTEQEKESLWQALHRQNGERSNLIIPT